jgi:hypothetical protein
VDNNYLDLAMNKRGFVHTLPSGRLSGRRRSRRQRCVCGDFVNLEDLPAQSSKMLLRVGFACVYS